MQSFEARAAGSVQGHVDPILSVVFPCLDEERSVGQCVSEALAAIEASGVTGEVVVVDNGSVDRSVEMATMAGARVVYEPTKGYGSALRTGIAAAGGQIVVMADADRTYELSAIPRLVKPILDGESDLVLGERLMSADNVSMPFLHRMVGTPVLSYLVRRAAGGISVTDSQSGFRAFRRRAVIELDLCSDGMEFASEMLIRAGRAGLRVTEIPTSYSERVGESKLNTFRDGFRHLRQILQLAPQLLLMGPGAVLLALGVVVQIGSLIQPAGAQVGSLRWQPVFLSSMALVLGLQMVLAGIAVQSLPSPFSTTVRGTAPSHSWTLPAGLYASAVGIGVDSYLFVRWLAHMPVLAFQESLAALASSALVDGLSLLGFFLVFPLLVKARSTGPRPQLLSAVVDGGDVHASALAAMDGSAAAPASAVPSVPA